jgi:ribosomal protein S18 acetylase RimI-like enzyme
MPTDTFVRLALPRDVATVAAIQARVWIESYASALPAEVLAQLEETATAQWTAALDEPPTDAHHLLVAIVFDQAAERVVGFAAVGPSDDDDTDPRQVGSLVALMVDPDQRGAGHGSRLLAAAVETMRANRFTTAITWQPEADAAMRTFLLTTGWAPDGARRELDTGLATLTELRLHTTVI